MSREQSPVGGSEPPPLLGLPPDHYRDRDKPDLILVRDGSLLPELCLKTGQPVTADGWQKKVAITWSPPWVYLGILGGLIPLVILILVAQKKGQIRYSLSSEAWEKIKKRRAIGFLILLGFFATIAACFVPGMDEELIGILIMTGFLLLIVSLVVFISSAPIRAVRFRNGWFQVKGAGAEFLSTLTARSLSDFQSDGSLPN